jgi:membrane associated rhomboid family serine protease
MVKNNFRRIREAAIIPLFLSGMMCLIFWLDTTQHWQLYRWGVFPRTSHGIFGIVLSPFIHGSINHLWSNIIPFTVVGWSVFYFYRNIAWQIMGFSFLLTGVWLWLAARPSYHIGASGVLYSLVVFVFFIGIWSKQRKLIAFSLLVAFLYGSMFWGLFPVKESVSWESHLWGSIAGFMLAWFYRVDIVKPVHYWPEEIEDFELKDSNYHNLNQSNSTIPDLKITYSMMQKKSSKENSSED